MNRKNLTPFFGLTTDEEKPTTVALLVEPAGEPSFKAGMVSFDSSLSNGRVGFAVFSRTLKDGPVSAQGILTS